MARKVLIRFFRPTTFWIAVLGIVAFAGSAAAYRDPPPDASGTGPNATAVAEYKFDAVIDPDIIAGRFTEVWARVYWPDPLPDNSPLLVFLHGNHFTCGRCSVGLPDVAVKPSGVLVPIPELQALLGLVSHPTDSLDLYAYAGIEQASETSFTVNGTLPFGYGNPLYSNTACLHEAASVTAASTNCAANTSRVWQITGGFWWDVYKGDFGRLRVGGQGAYTERQVFAGIGGGPNTNEGIFMASLRYYPL